MGGCGRNKFRGSLGSFGFAAEINFDDALVGLDLIDRTFTQNVTLMKDDDFAAL